MNDLVSIIVPVFNVEEYLTKCLDSISRQTYKHWEAILVDDGSTDKSGEICDRYSVLDNRFRVIHKANQGVSSARNVGLKYVKGGWVSFCDADDYLNEDMLEKTVGQWGQDQEIQLLACAANEVIYDENEQIQIAPNLIWNISRPVVVSDRSEIYQKALCLTGTLWNKLVRTETIKDVRFDEEMRYGEDTVFLAKILANVHRAVLIPEALYNYYKNRPGNVVSSVNIDRDIEHLNNETLVYKLLKGSGAESSVILRLLTLTDMKLKKWKEHGICISKREIVRIGKILRRVSIIDTVCLIVRGNYKQGLLFFAACYFPSVYYEWRYRS